jgi:PKD repeat protein/predicted esterase
MKPFYLLLFFISLIRLNHAQNNCESVRYKSEIFNSTQNTVGIKFGEADPYGLINNQDLYLDIIQPIGDTLEKRPLILHQFGGGFLIGWRTEPVIPQMAEMYAKRGFVFATIDYRLGFNVADGQSAERAVYRAAQDMASALRYLVDNADTYGIDTSAIFLTGTSAGCFSALVNGFMEEADRSDLPSTYGIFLEPQDLGCLQCSGNNNFNNQRVNVHGIINNWGAMLDTSYINPAANAKDNLPVISFHGTEDLIVPYGAGYPFSLPIFPTVQGSSLVHQRLNNLHIKNRFFPLQGLGHEPQLLQLQTWVTDTIIRQGSLFVYEILYGDSIEIQGDNTLCLNTLSSYSVPFNLGSTYCWEVVGGNIQSLNQNQISIVWTSAGIHELKVTELDKRQISKGASLLVEITPPPTPLFTEISLDGFTTFTSSNTANTFVWNFGDGNFAQGNPVNHQYADTGVFQVSLSITNDYCSGSATFPVNSSICPEAAISFIQNDSSFTFYSSSAFANEALWITQDGSIIQGDSFTLHSTSEGSYSLSLISSNAYCSDTTTAQIPIQFCSESNFTYSQNTNVIQFQDQSYNAFFHDWEFGDGNISALPNPTHTYASSGSYTVKLKTFSSNACVDSSEQVLIIDLGSNLYEFNPLKLNILPNPFENYIQIIGLEAKESYEYKVWDLSGKLLLQNNLEQAKISFENLSQGSYFLELSQNQNVILYHKIVKK